MKEKKKREWIYAGRAFDCGGYHWSTCSNQHSDFYITA